MTCDDEKITQSCYQNGSIYLLISLIEMTSYMFLLILTVFRIFKKSPAYIYFICVYAVLRFVNWLFEFINKYFLLPDFIKHQLYILPLFLILIIFQNLLHQWIQYLTTYERIIKITLQITLLLSIILYITSTILYLINHYYISKDQYKFLVVGYTGVFFGLLYIIVAIVNIFIWHKIRYLHLLDIEIYGDVKIIIKFLAISTFSFLIYSGLILSEGIYQIVSRQFVFLCCNNGRTYTTYEGIEFLFFTSQIFPVFTMVIVSIINFIKSQRNPPFLRLPGDQINE